MTPAELTLAQNYRTRQVALEGAVALSMRPLWDIIDLGDMARTVPVWLGAAMNVVEDGHRRSADLARSYIATATRLSLGSVPSGTLPRPSLVTAAARTSLLVRGPGIITRARARRTDLNAATLLAIAESMRAGSRHALSGSRDTIDAYIEGDRRIGWRRMTASTACSFCRSLAGRGAVYSETTVGFQAHDGCNCQPGMEQRT